MKLKGTITVFLSFLLVFVTGLFFTMSEVVRYWCLQGQAERAAALACESTMADYCRPLWEEFGILGLDGGYGEPVLRKQVYNDRLAEYMEKNGRPEGVSLMAQYPAVSELADYHILTDAGGRGLVREAAQHMKDTIPEAALNSAREMGKDLLSGEGGGSETEELLESGKKAMDAGKKNQSRDEDEEKVIPEGLKTLETVTGTEPDKATMDKIDAAENPIESVGDVSATGILDKVLRGKTVSGAVISDDRPSKRNRAEGTEAGRDATLAEKELFKFWAGNTLQNYLTDYGRSGLKYEAEYVICGHSSDRENLQGVVSRILGIREGANIAAIVSDPGKSGQAEAMAWGIALAMGMPEMKEAIKAAIIGSWAYTESVLDLRLLLNGGRVSLMKSGAEWTTPIWMIVPYLSSDRQANNCSIGMTYKGYLQGFLLAMFTDTAAMRSCDILESAIRQDSNYAYFRMDNCIYEVRARETYQASPLFLSYVLILQGNVQTYTFEYPQSLSYIS